MKITVLGGDGYCGWATALYLSRQGHRVAIVDSFIRRQWDFELGVQTLTPIRPLPERLRAWKRVSGRDIEYYTGDITDFEFLGSVIERERPDAVVHFAEQRAAPYSMIDRQHAVFTQVNNVVGTLNLLFAIRELVPECHLVKLGPWESTGPRTSTSKRATSPSSTTDARILCRIRSSRARSTTSRRSTTATTSCSPAALGGCGRRI
jgi:nucleoside-diphosphate-sugar epimerase